MASAHRRPCRGSTSRRPSRRSRTRNAPLDRRARAWSRASRVDGRPRSWPWRCRRRRRARGPSSPPGHRRGRRGRRRRPGRRRPPRHDRRRARRPRVGCSRARAGQPTAGRRRVAGAPAPARVNPFTDSRTRDPRGRVGQGWRRQVVGHHQPLGRARATVVTGSPRSTPTCGASRCRACSASTAPPGLIDDVIVPPEANGVRLISMGFFAREDQAVDVAGPDAAQGARAVPHRRVLG